jgi:cytochrome c peroxidase
MPSVIFQVMSNSVHTVAARRNTAFLVVAAMAGCLPGEDMVDVFTTEEFAQVQKLGPLGEIPADPTNMYADHAGAAAFGQRLFFEKSYAHALTVSDPTLGVVGDKGKVACVSCHDPKLFYAEARGSGVSLGVKWTTRNSPTLVNAAFNTWWSWGGKQDTIWHQGANGCESADNFGGNRLEYAHILYAKYRTDYDAIFAVPLDPALDPLAADAARFPAQGKPKSKAADPDGPWELMTAADRDIINRILANAGKSLEAYQRQLISRNAPIDRYIAGDHDALSPPQKRGLALFLGKAACVDCHSGPTFSDQQFHNTGVPQIGLNVPRTDEGRFADLSRLLSNTFNGGGKYSDDPAAGAAKLAGMTLGDDLQGKFLTPMLRHIESTGPYFHNGSLNTLWDVVHFYNMGGGSSGFSGVKDPRMVPLLLTTKEEDDLVSFLKALTGEPVPAALSINTAAP